MDLSILVADDEENFLFLMNKTLSREGYRVKTAKDAAQAIEYLDQETFHVAILDVRMYPIDGITLLAEIKKRSPSTQAIMVTAYPTPDTRSKCAEYGAARYMLKPVQLDDLKGVIRHLIEAQDG